MVKARMVSTRATLYWNSLAYKLFMVTCIEKRPAEQNFKGTKLVLPTLKAKIKMLVISLPRTVNAFELSSAGLFSKIQSLFFKPNR